MRAHIEKGKFHHGYLLVGDLEVSREMAFEAARVILKSKLDFFHQIFDLFSIKDSHDLRQRASLKPFLGDSKVFVIEISSFSIESSNALLKTFEEPYEGTYFFIITSSLEEIIPTLRSRLTIISSPRKDFGLDKEKEDFYKKFLAGLPNRRMEMVKKNFEDKQKTIEFLNEMEVVVHKLGFFLILKKIQECKNFLYQKGGSGKMVLEHLALTLPQMI